MGGDEFCAVLPGSHGDVSALPERLGRLCSAEPTRDAPSLSIGLVRDDEEPTTDLQSLIQRADHVMYVLKRWRKESRFAADGEVRTEPTQTPVQTPEREPGKTL